MKEVVYIVGAGVNQAVKDWDDDSPPLLNNFFNIALGLDSLRFYSVDIDIRSLADFTILKSQGVHGLASDLQWLYSFFNPSKIRSHPPGCFYIISRRGSLGMGHFPYHNWHKIEKEDIVKEVGISVEYGSVYKQPKDMGAYKSVGDQEHVQIIGLYVDDGLGMAGIAEKLGRSTRTPHAHIKRHNEAVIRSGFCGSCKRIGGAHFDERAEKG
jgi:hypothetical protein